MFQKVLFIVLLIFMLIACAMPNNDEKNNSPDSNSADVTPPNNQDKVFPQSTIQKSSSKLAIFSSGDAGNTVWLAPSGTVKFIEGATITKALGTATVIDVPSVEGEYKLFLIDNAGNISNESKATLTVDDTPPEKQDIVFTESKAVQGGCDVSIIAPGNKNYKVWFAPSGTTEFVESTTMTKAVDGTSTTIIAPQHEGDYRIFIIDEAGNVSKSSIAVLTVDNTAPINQDLVFSASIKVKSGSDVVIANSGDAGNSIWLAKPGQLTLIKGYAQTTANGNATKIKAPALSGEYKLYVVDSAKNISQPSTATLLVDAAPCEMAPIYTRNLTNKIALSWSNPKDADYKKIEIYRSENNVPPANSLAGAKMIFSGTTETSFDDIDVKTGTKYYYISVTYDDVGNTRESNISFAFFPFLDMIGPTEYAGDHMGLAYQNSMIYYIGGCTPGLPSITNRAYSLSTTDGSITQLQSMPSILSLINANVLNNRIFTFGGCPVEGVVDYVYSYDITTNTWESGTPMPFAAARVATEVYNNEIYLIGGVTEGRIASNGLNNCRKYSVTTGAAGVYTDLASKPSNHITYGSALYNGKIYSFAESTSDTIVEIYDIASNTWSMGFSLPVKRNNYACVILDSKIYIIGGTVSGKVTPRIDVYDILTNSWSRKSDLPYPIAAISGIASGNDIYLIGGGNGNYYEGTIKIYKPLLDPGK